MEPKTSQVLLAVFTVVTIIGSAALVYNAQSAQQLAAAISGGSGGPSTSSGGAGFFGLFGGSTTNSTNGINVPGEEPGSVGMPTNLKLKQVNSNNISFSWVDDAQRNVRYDIYRDDGHGGSLQYLATTYGDDYIDYGLQSNVLYTYAIDAVTNSGVKSAQTASVATTTLTTGSIPATPTNLHVVSSSDGSVTVAWNQSADATAYFVYLEYPSQALSMPFRVEGATTTSFTITGLEAQSYYHIAVAAHDAPGNTSASSQPVTAQTTGTGGFCVLNSLRGDSIKTGASTGLTLWSQAYATSVDIEPAIGKVTNNAAYNVDGPVYSTGNLSKTTTFTATMTLEDGRTLKCQKTITVIGGSGS